MKLKVLVILFAQVDYRVNGPTILLEVGRVVGTLVGRVAPEVGVVVESALIDRQELMSREVSIIRALELAVVSDVGIVDRLFHP